MTYLQRVIDFWFWLAQQMQGAGFLIAVIVFVIAVLSVWAYFSTEDSLRGLGK